MKKTDAAKKHAKKLARRERVAAKEKWAEDRNKRREFPEFEFVPNGAPPKFVEAVRIAVEAVDFRDKAMFQDFERDVYRRVAKVGSQQATGELQALADALPNGEALNFRFFTNLGEHVFHKIREETLRQFIPFHDVLFRPRGHSIQVYFRSLKQVKGPWGTTYHSRHEPKLEVNGRQLTVGFTDHAIKMACERLALEVPLTYTELGNVFAFFDQCLEFELCNLSDGRLCFTFFENCVPPFPSYRLLAAILGGSRVLGRDYAYRVGYCPAVVEGRFIKAKTCIFPGFSKTPEYGRILAAGLPRETKETMKQQAKSMDARKLWEPGGVELLRWFHHQGVPQVRPGKVRYAKAAG
jgi:hypothetical protein